MKQLRTLSSAKREGSPTIVWTLNTFLNERPCWSVASRTLATHAWLRTRAHANSARHSLPFFINDAPDSGANDHSWLLSPFLQSNRSTCPVDSTSMHMEQFVPCDFTLHGGVSTEER